MSKLFLFIILLLSSIGTCLYAQTPASDTLTRQQFIRTQTLQADTLNQMALQLAIPTASSKDLNQAIEYIMKGLHVYSRYRDSTGLRQTFDHLALVYHLQKKYVQAKWFYIQSNSLSRELKDTLNIIQSLIALSSVKTDIKDYALAQRDLNEALDLAKTKPGIDQQIIVQEALTQFYNKKGDTSKAALAMNRIIFLKDSVSKLDENLKLALLKKQQDAEQLAQKQKQAILQKEELRVQNLVHQKNAITVITVSIIAIVTTLFFLLYLKRKKKRRAKK